MIPGLLGPGPHSVEEVFQHEPIATIPNGVDPECMKPPATEEAATFPEAPSKMELPRGRQDHQGPSCSEWLSESLDTNEEHSPVGSISV